MKWLWLALACLLLQVVQAAAESPAPQMPATTPQFQAVLGAPQHRDAVLRTAQHSTTWLKHGCTTGTFTPLQTVRIWKPLGFDASGAPIEGTWGESVEAVGCGLSRRLNVVTVVRAPRMLQTGLLAPGETRGDPVLQGDASRYVFTAALIRSPGCKQAYLDDTKAVQKSDPSVSDDLRSGKVWFENWSVVACGQNVEVEVEFIRAAVGIRIVTHAF